MTVPNPAPRAAYGSVEFFTKVLRRDSADEHLVYVRFLNLIEALTGDPAARDDAQQLEHIRNALAAAESLLAEIWAATPAERLLDASARRWAEQNESWARQVALADPASRDGYAEGYLDCLGIVTHAGPETLAALSSLAARRRTLTEDELNLIRAAGRDDGGFAEEYLQRMRSARAAADTRLPGTVAEIRGAAAAALAAWGTVSPEDAARLLGSWARRKELTDADVAAVLDAVFGETERSLETQEASR